MNSKNENPTDHHAEDENSEAERVDAADVPEGSEIELAPSDCEEDVAQDKTPNGTEPLTNERSRRPMEILVIVLTTIGVFIAAVFGVNQYKNAEAERKLSIVRIGSQTTYEWSSNFVSLLYEGKDAVESAKELSGVLRVKNYLAEPMQRIQVKIWIGVDPDLVKYPFRSGPKAYSIYEAGHSVIESGGALEIPLMERVRQSGFDIESLFNTGKWDQMLDNWGARLSMIAPTVDLGSTNAGGAPFFNEANARVRALLGRIVLEYFAGGVRYSNLLTLVIGTAVGDDGRPWITLTKEGFAGGHVNTSTSSVNKQGFSKIVHSDGKVDILQIPQVSSTNHEGLLDVLPPNCSFHDISAEDGNKNRFVFTHIICDQRQ